MAYVILNILAMAAATFAFFCAMQISPWAVYMLLAIVAFKFFDGIATWIWHEAHREQR